MDTVNPKVSRYERGLNEYLDVLLDDEVIVWRINGRAGLRPIAADSEEEALEKYLAIPRKGLINGRW